MGINMLTKEEKQLRRKVRQRNILYQQQLISESLSKIKHVCLTIIPPLFNAIFDSTVRRIELNIVRPDDSVITNNCKEKKDGSLKVGSNNLLDKAIYLEEIFRW